jgi:IS5 family transposase
VIDRASERIISVDIFNGKAHDGTIFKSTLHISAEITALLDSGYRGVQRVHKKSMIVMKHKADLDKLNEEQQQEQRKKNKEISSCRMKVEHIIGRIKRFNIVSQRYRNRRRRFGLRMNLICGIINYEYSSSSVS